MFNGPFIQPASTPPASVPITAANNGLSVTPAKTVVLGNDEGAAGDPAQLLSNREIEFQTFYTALINTVSRFIRNGNVLTFGSNAAIGTHVTSNPTGGKIPAVIVDSTGNFFSVIYGSTDGPVIHQVIDNAAANKMARIIQEDFFNGNLFIQQFTGLFFQWNLNGSQDLLFYDITNGNFVVGGNVGSPAPSFLLFYIAGALSFFNAVAAEVANYQLLLTDSNKHISNDGAAAAVELTAPNSTVLGSIVKGLPVFELEVAAAQAFRFRCNGDQTIRYDINISAAGGGLEGSIVGSVVRIQATSPTTFVVVSVVGTWLVV